jgi:hypothetical protein
MPIEGAHKCKHSYAKILKWSKVMEVQQFSKPPWTSFKVFGGHINFVGVRKNVEMDSIEFVFLDAQRMSKVVGVGATLGPGYSHKW